MPLRHLVDRRGRDPDQRQAARPRAAWILGDGGAKLVFISDDTAAALAEAKSDLPAAMKTLSVDSDAYRKMGEGGGTPSPLPREANDLAWLFYTPAPPAAPRA